MKSGLVPFVSVVLTATIATALIVDGVAAAPRAQDAAAVEKEDVIYMSDGRVLHGKIISETATQIVFQYKDRKLNLQTKMTLRKDEIAKVERDQPVEGAPATPAGSGTPAASSTQGTAPKTGGTSTDKGADSHTYGAMQTQSDDPSVARFYIIPMTGQMGTDVNQHVYKDMIEDIKKHNPTYLVIKMKCMDDEDRIYSRVEQTERGLTNINFMDIYRELVSVFHDEMPEIKQVMWIEDSKGISSCIAMSWADLYMMPTARLGGMSAAAVNFLQVQDDFNTLGKYREAYMAGLKGIVNYGGYDHALIDAMVRPEMKLSASWKGRDVLWARDDSGEYVVDNLEDFTTAFNAKTAEDFSISDGTAETIEDLALLLGVREFRVLDSAGEQIFNKYVEDWRRDLAKCRTWLEEYQRFMEWATGQDEVKYLGQAKGRLEDVIAAMKRYEAVKIRMGMEYGLDELSLTVMIEQIKERLRALKDAPGGGGGGRAGGGGGGRLGGGSR